jgi:hypothetical protein
VTITFPRPTARCDIENHSIPSLFNSAPHFTSA